MPLLDIPTIYVLMLAVMVLLGALKALYTAKALGRNRVESAVDELVPLVPEAPVESDVTPADLTISRPKQARRATKTGGSLIASE